MTAQTVVTAVSQDIRKLLAASGTDAAVLLDYTDRVHKDVLHTSIHAHLNHAVQNITTSANTVNYTLSACRKINFVYDRTKERALFPLVAMAPAEAQTEGTVTHSSLPKFYKFVGTTSLYLIPTPKQTLTLEVHTESNIATLAALGSTLLVPEDSLDMMVAGVNALAYAFLQKETESNRWKSEYEKLKQGEAVLQ